MHQCQAACYSRVDCLFFQYKAGDGKGNDGGECWYGTKDLAQYTGHFPEKVYGGVLDLPLQGKVGCPEGRKQCPSSGTGYHSRCVESCDSCDGFSVEDKENEKAPKCVRSPGQAVCNADNWVDTFNQKSLSEYRCQGLRKRQVVMAEDADFGPHAVCRELCCGDPDCILYQVRRDFAKQQGLKKGQGVTCWLGHRFANSEPMFECTKKVRQLPFVRQWVGGYLEKRGCGDAGFSCLTSGECVQSCVAQCPGAPRAIAGPDGKSCAEDDTEAGEEAGADVVGDVIDWAKDHKTHYLFLQRDLSHQDEIAAADTLLMVKQNRGRLITTSSISEEACAAMAISPDEPCEPDAKANGTAPAGCKCTYKAPQPCSTWFSGPYQVRPVISEAGLILASSEHCICTGRTCHFGLLDRVPPIKISQPDEVAVNL